MISELGIMTSDTLSLLISKIPWIISSVSSSITYLSASVIPNDTELNSCTVAGGVCTVDVSEEFVSRKGSANEQMIIYSVVNTLCRMDGIEKVKFLVDGKDVEFFGSYVFDEPFAEDTNLIKVGY